MKLLLIAAVLLAQAAPAGTDVDSVALHQLADTALVEGRYQDAQAAFLAAQKADPENATLMYGLACAQARQDLDVDALESLAKAKELGYRDAAAVREDRDLGSVRYSRLFEELFPREDVESSKAVGWSFRITGDGVKPVVLGSTWVACALAQGGIEVLEQATGKVHASLLPMATPVVALAASPNGLELASLHADGRMAITHLSSGKVVVHAAMPQATCLEGASALAFVAGGERVIARTDEGPLVWNRDQGTCSPLPAGRWRLSMTSPKSPFLPRISGTTVRLHDARSPSAEPAVIEFEAPVRSAQMGPGGAVLAVGAGPGELKLIDLADRSVRWSAVITDTATGEPTDLFGEALSVTSLSFNPSGSRISACTSPGFFAAVFDVESGEMLWRTAHLGGRMGTPMPLLCGAELTVGDGWEFAWSTESGRAVEGWQGKSRRPVAILGSKVLFSDRRAVELMDGRTSRTLWRFDGSQGTPRRLEHPSGWIAGSFDAAAHPGDVGRFDPKRLRRGLYGVKLLPPPGDSAKDD